MKAKRLLHWVVCGGAALALGMSAGEASDWQPSEWQGESAFSLEGEGWVAVVSVERARLMHFGRDFAETSNWLWAPERGGAFRWGGHVFWLGPQSEWGWPPPPAWDEQGPRDVSLENGKLRLELYDAGDGWPLVSRVYESVDGKLSCRIEFSGGTRAAQSVQIMQIDPEAVVQAQADKKAAPEHGFVELAIVGRPGLRYAFSPSAMVQAKGEEVEMRYSGEQEKIGFVPQTLVARRGSELFFMGRGKQAVNESGRPDDGFFTQVYLGHPMLPVIELEQLSPLHAVGEGASSEVLLWLGSGE